MPTLIEPSATLGRMTRRPIAALARDRRGLALLEFALALPLVLAVGGWGIELSSLALCNLRISQYALNLADAASRVGQNAGSGVTNMREVDVIDIMQGVRLQGAGLNLTTQGRVTLSSLENIQQSYDTARVQRIHWQRCIGVKSGTGYDSSYGTTTAAAGTDGTQANAGTSAPNGMGNAGAQVNAPTDSGVMFVEINYQYQPLFGSLYVSPRIIHYVASFIVRDSRSFVQIYNPSPMSTPITCDKYTT